MTTLQSMQRRAAMVVAACMVAACAGDDSVSVSSTSVPSSSVATSTIAPATTVPVTTVATTTVPPTTVSPTTAATTTPIITDPPSTTVPAGSTAEEIVRALADDSLDGRDNLQPGGEMARSLIIEELGSFAEPLSTLSGFEQPFAEGVNVLGVVPGSDLADEYVIVGGHYDHLSTCRNPTPDDEICNGAADNATGVAAALVIGRRIASTMPRRSVVVALWDAEEDGLLGATHYVANPVVPLESTVAYVNFDLIGSNLLPSLANRTLLIGAETGGTALVESSDAASAASTLDVASLSIVFGQGRSDHAPFARAGVPIVFASDSTNGCYHSVADEVDRVDFGKLDEQIAIGERLVTELSSTATPPSFDATAPLVSLADVETLRDLVVAAQSDAAVLDSAIVDVASLASELDAIVAAGAPELGDDDIAVVLGGAAALVEALGASPCI